MAAHAVWHAGVPVLPWRPRLNLPLSCPKLILGRESVENSSMNEETRLAWVESDALREFNAIKLERIAEGQDIIDLSMINPDILPSRFMLDKLLEAAVRPSNHRYAVARGVRRLREAFAEKYRAAWGVALNPEDEVCVTMGSKDAIEHVLMAIGTDGAKVLVGTPTYPNYLSAIKLARLEPCFFEISNDEELLLETIHRMAQQHSPSALLLNFPNNPTGILASRRFYERIMELAARYRFIVINDFVYGEMCHAGARAVSMLEIPGASEYAAEIYSLSKAYSVPGWRVGALVGNPRLVRALSLLKAHVDYGIFLPLQHAAAAALTQDNRIAEQVTAQYEERCQLLVAGLQRLGWDVTPPRAGCSVWARLPEWLRREGSFAVSQRLLREAGVAVYPGAAFGVSKAGASDSDRHFFDEWLRFALVVPPSRVRTVIDRLAMWGQAQRRAEVCMQGAVGE